ncbi:MAG: hypothetical protein U0L51_02325 [Olegusella sp.]|nr:hypothetical protein [Olegusella sp.]
MEVKRPYHGIDLVDPLVVAEYWEGHEVECVYRAWESFCGQVDPYVSHVEDPRGVDIDLVDSMFYEWFVFDYQTDEGRTPLELYIELAPDGMGEEQRALLRQLADSQRFAQYWVMDQDPKAGSSELVDAATGEEIVLLDDVVAQTSWWNAGLVGLRVARLGGSWFMVGRTPLHDAGRRLPDVPRIERPSFLRLVQKTVGLDGEYSASVCLHECVLNAA